MTGGATIDYPTMIDQTSDDLLQDLLNGNNDPWMFHQANTRDYDGGGHSLLSELLTATFDKYAAAATFPIVSPTMDELAARVTSRMTFDSLRRGGHDSTADLCDDQRHAAATVPVTGFCVPGAESYGGQTISVSPPRCRPVGDVVAHELQSGLRNRRRRRSFRGERGFRRERRGWNRRRGHERLNQRKRRERRRWPGRVSPAARAATQPSTRARRAAAAREKPAHAAAAAPAGHRCRRRRRRRRERGGRPSGPGEQRRRHAGNGFRRRGQGRRRQWCGGRARRQRARRLRLPRERRATERWRAAAWSPRSGRRAPNAPAVGR